MVTGGLSRSNWHWGIPICTVYVYFVIYCKCNKWSFRDSTWVTEAGLRILITGALPPGQTVFITDASHEVFQPSDPGAGLFCIGGDQVQGLNSLPVVNTEAAVWVEAVVCIPPEDLWLFPLADFMDGINSYWNKWSWNVVRVIQNLCLDQRY